MKITREMRDSVTHGNPITITNSNGEQGLYLKVADRLDWFLAVCDKYKLQHRFAPMAQETVTKKAPPEDPYGRTEIVVERVKMGLYVDGELLGEAYGSSEVLYKTLENAETSAKGRVLSDLGFNIKDGMNDPGVLDGNAAYLSCDAPIPAAPLVIPGATGQPFNVIPAAQTSQPSVPAPVPTPAPVQYANAWEDPNMVATAKAFSVPTGNYKGKSVGEMLAMSDWHVKFYANMNPDKEFKSAGRYPDFVAACKIVWLSIHPEDAK